MFEIRLRIYVIRIRDSIVASFWVAGNLTAIWKWISPFRRAFAEGTRSSKIAAPVCWKSRENKC